MEALTKKQEIILDYLKKYTVNHGYPPTVREIGDALKVSSPATIHMHLAKLADKGYIKKNNSKNRVLEILVENEYEHLNDDSIKVPLLGKITAGNPITAIEMPDEYMTVPTSLIPKNKEIFALTVSGESMINVGIYDGDIVLVERKQTANNGDIVVAMNDDDEATLKTFYRESNYIRLQTEHDTMDPILLSNVKIIGKAISLYQQF